MRAYVLTQFGLTNIRGEERPEPAAGPGEVVLEVRAISLNFRDILIAKGLYNPRLKLPAIPTSDAAGVVAAVGAGVTRVRVGDKVMTHFVAGWLDGPMKSEYLKTTLGTPGPGMAAQRVVLSADAVLPIPADYSFAEAATLPIAALTAWSALVTVGALQAGQTVLTLGTGGVSVFALQIAKVLGARVIITSSSDEKLARAAKLGADCGINYRTTPAWEKRVLEITDGLGADIVVENVGGDTLEQSLSATRTGGVVALLGAIGSMKAEINTGQVLMRRLRIAGVMVDSRASFDTMARFVQERRIRPVIDRRFSFDEFPDALRYMETAAHFGKIVVEY